VGPFPALREVLVVLLTLLPFDFLVQISASNFNKFRAHYQSSQHIKFDWCNWEGKPTGWIGPLPAVEMVSDGRAFASPRMLRFRDPDSFVAGNLSACVPQWRSVLENYPKKEEILSYINDGVNVFHFFTPFKGSFQGKKYCSNTPPEAIFPNAASCGPFSDFISKTIRDRVIDGSLHILGKVGACHPPHLVLTITIEPCKPRMRHDERFLICWIKDCPFSS